MTFEAGNVYVPGMPDPNSPSGYNEAATPSFTQSLIEECAVFPNGQHDDQVDAFSQAMNWARGRAARARVTVNMEAIGQVGDIPVAGRWQ